MIQWRSERDPKDKIHLIKEALSLGVGDGSGVWIGAQQGGLLVAGGISAALFSHWVSTALVPLGGWAVIVPMRWQAMVFGQCHPCWGHQQ